MVQSIHPMQHQTNLLHLVFIACLLCLGASSCTSESGARVWTEGAQLQTSQGTYFIKGVCYHPVPVGQDKRSFENLTQDLESHAGNGGQHPSRV